MKIEFIRRGAATRLILIFAGWSTDIRYYKDCIADGWDTAVITDYRDLTLPEIPGCYTSIYVFAYSLGVWAASHAKIKAAAKVAIFGTPIPVSGIYGIPDAIFNGTSEGLTERSLSKFHLRMAGDKNAYEKMRESLPSYPDIQALKEELDYIAANANEDIDVNYRWDRAYVANQDKIIPAENQRRYWSASRGTEMVCLDSPHAADIAAIIRECIPDQKSIGNGFADALPTYREYAKVQTEVCLRMSEIIAEIFGEGVTSVRSLLEIGPGKGLLTEGWSRYLRPDEATYIDLYEMQKFGHAGDERYLVRDAEEWFEHTDEKFDIILSASAIQWFADPVRFVSNLQAHLNPGGAAIVSTYVKGNLSELDAVRPSPIIYREAEEYLDAADDMETERWTRTLEFQSSRSLLLHLKHTGVKPNVKATRRVCNQPVPLTSLPSQLTYTPLIIKIRKP